MKTKNFLWMFLLKLMKLLQNRKSFYQLCLLLRGQICFKEKLMPLFITTIMLMVGFNAGAYNFMVDGLCYNINSDGTSVTVTYKQDPRSGADNSLRYNAYPELSGDLIISETVKNNGKNYTVTGISDEAFANVVNLTSVTIPNSVTSIWSYAFYGCSGLTSVTIGNSVTSIGRYVFSGCSGLTNVTIPNSVTEIGESAFWGCSGLTSVTIPNSVTEIGSGAFNGCSGLTSIKVASGNTKYDSRNNCNAIIETSTNSLIAGCKNTTIPNSVTSIGREAFSGCSGLTSVTIPNSVTSIGYSAFSGCSGLTSVTIPNSVTSIGSYAFYGCSGLANVTIPNSVTSIDAWAFKDCSGLTNITIPNSVTSIGACAFWGCSGLTSVTIPNSVTSIGGSAFYNCSGLTSVTIPNSVTEIGGSAFYNCSGLTSVTIPSSVTSMGGSDFEGCSGLKTVNWNAKRIADFTSSSGAFNCQKSITTFNIGNGVEKIPAYLCNGLSNITNITIPNSVTSIGKSAFSGCSGLTSVTIPNSVTSIGSYAFSGCSGLTSVTIPNSVTSIGDGAFRGCSGLTGSLTIPNSVTSIGSYAFYNCIGLTSINIPNSVTSISDYAFSGCSGLQDIYSEILNPATVTKGTNIFQNVPFTTCTLHIPARTKVLYQLTSPWNSFNNIVEASQLATGISLSQTSASMQVGNTLQLSANIKPSDVTNTTVSWATSDENVASVSNSGLVTAKSFGTATITATTTDGTNLTASCLITVLPPLATSLSFESDEMEVNIGDDVTINAIITPSDASTALNWSSSKPAVATIDANGRLHALTAGMTVIVATTTDGSNLSATCLVTVKSVTAESITLDKTSLLLAKDESATLSATVLPENATNKGVTWASSNTAVAKVDANGKVTAVAPGTAKITATTADGTNLSASCTVTVVEAWVSEIVLDKTQVVIPLEYTDTIHATVLPENAAIKEVAWTSSNEAVAVVDSEGVVTATGVGSATITATATDGTGITASCLVTVPAADGNYLSAESFTVVRGNEVIVPIAMTNSKAIAALQCELRLTGGIEVATDEYGDFDIYLSDRARDHELNCTQRPDFMQILAASITKSPFRSNTGTLFFIHLKADKNLEEGTYMMALRNITLSTVDGERIHTEDVEVTIGIEPYLKGDANGDNHVDVADFLTVANHILYKNPFPFYFRAADVDNNGLVDSNDLTHVTNIGLGKTTSAHAPRMNAEAQVIAPVAAVSARGSQLVVGLSNVMELSALQLDVLLPEGLTIDDVALSTRAAADHMTAWNETPDGMTRILVASPSAAALSGIDGEVMTITLAGSSVNGDNRVKMTNIIASEPASVRHELDDITAELTVTAVDDLNAYSQVRIYAEDARIIIESPAAGEAQLIGINGVVTKLRVNAGRNVYAMDSHGIAIVKMNNNVAKLRY